MAEPSVNFATAPAGTTIEKYITAVLPEEVQEYLQATLVQEYADQRDIGQEPSNLLVDGRPAPLGLASIAQVKRRGQLIYGDTDQLIAAARFALSELERLTPAKSGAGRGSFRVFINGAEIGGPEMLTDALADRLGTNDVLRVVGPTVIYGRRLAWQSGKTRTISLRAGR